MTEKEVATVLYALRFLQANYDEAVVDEMKSGGLFHFEEHSPLTLDEIDELCGRLALGLEAEVYTAIGTCDREKHQGAIRGFYQSSRTWSKNLREDNVEEIDFGLDYLDGGTSGRMSMVWRDLGDHEPAARLVCYVGAWDALCCFSDLLEKMAGLDEQNPQPEEFVRLLLDCGFTDLTEEETPLEFQVGFKILSVFSAEMPSTKDVVDSTDFAVIDKIVQQEMYIVVAKEDELRLKSVHMNKEDAFAALKEWATKGCVTGVVVKKGLF
jgi:hypothetical protein